MNRYEDKVRILICGILEIDNCNDIGVKDDLQSIGMDSLNCMQLIVAIEELFQIEIPEEKLGLRFIRNIRDICKLIEEVKDNGSVQTIPV